MQHSPCFDIFNCNAGRVSYKADIYSFGVVQIWEICTVERPVRGRMRDIRQERLPRALGDKTVHCNHTRVSYALHTARASCKRHSVQFYFHRSWTHDISTSSTCRVPEEAPEEVAKLYTRCTSLKPYNWKSAFEALMQVSRFARN